MITPLAIRQDVFLTRHFAYILPPFAFILLFYILFSSLSSFFRPPFSFFSLAHSAYFSPNVVGYYTSLLCGGGEGGERGVFFKAIYTSAAVTVNHGVSKNEESGGITAVIHKSQLHLFH